MVTRLLLPVAVAIAALSGAAAAAAATPPPPPAAPAPGVVPAPGPYAWAEPAAARLAADGDWPELAGADLARDATRADLDRAIGVLTGVPRSRPNPARPATAWSAHLLVVRALGLEAERRSLNRLATDDGARLRLPRHFGSEVLVRELGLVHNHPAQRDDLERSRRQALALGDLVHMLDRAREVSTWERQELSRYREIALPTMSPARRAVVQAALWQVGQNYVWAGDWPGVRSPWGAQAHGGFDCSGLVWWAFKGSAGPRQMELGRGLLGRTADAMAWERPAERAPVGALAPGDLVFFGRGGPKARRGSISHTGIALGNGWMVHSSGSRGGVSVSFLGTYWPSATAFGRHVAELGA